MMSSYKMEMRPPREYKKREMISFKAPLLIMASEKDICEKRVMEICSSDHKDPLAIRRVIDLSHSL